MTTLFSTMSWIWPAKAQAAARRARVAELMAPFETLHRIQWSAPWAPATCGAPAQPVRRKRAT